MQEEIKALIQNRTWDLVPRTPTANIVGSKWVFKTKLKEDRTIDRYKARLVAQGFSQILSLDFGETFSLVIKHTTIKLILSLAVTLGWTMRQLDVKNAFLHGFLKEEVFMEQPPGFINKDLPNHVCKLNRSIYGLKQGPRARYLKGTMEHGIRFFKQSSLRLTGFCDADWAECTNTRRSTSGAAEITWLTFLLHDIGIQLCEPPQLLCDNLSALHMIYVADIFTKAFPKTSFQVFRFKLGVHKLPLTSLRGLIKETPTQPVDNAIC
ncbi:Retrovirus-related Pol polyprotein from transposon RE1 [Vitis vinifera]|uniref:Retrovirus-related Pol polyprotein from transposon RE1 n=1 Tax=Vitis vinifera TaxID=29760 RepID=A0A438FSD6_VITVI|nr:Retrovirus-related Pol polyprotein from transposon RE1 [Vitis vinifera]